VSREVTFDTICVVLEEYGDQRIEDIADHMMAALALLGDDLLDHLDPPVGLRRWLESHGLSLIATHSPTPPAVWGAIDGTDDEEEGEVLEDGPGESPVLQVGGYVEYRTAPSGPRHQSQVGSGRIVQIAGEVVIVATGSGHDEWLDRNTDFIRLVGAP
jgi:hypothetical protein